MYQTLQLECRDAVAVITLNRPEQLNAYTVRMGEEMVDAFDALRSEAAAPLIAAITGLG